MKILIQDDEGVRELEEGFASEYELQVFLRDHAELIPLDEIDLGTPPLLCIGFEVNVASGSQDLLYIDETGLLTIVETKLGRNPEARREVVGQILEYAAQAVEWSQIDLESRVEKFLSGKDAPPGYKGLSLRRAVERFLEETHPPRLEDFAYEDFAQSAQANLERGHIRLIIAVDEPPPPLRKTVEFVNHFSERFEIYLFQLKRFHDKATQANIFVPALFGRVARPGIRRPPGRPWDKDRFLRQASEESPQSVPALKRLIEFAESQKAIVWGRGASVASFQCSFMTGGGKRVAAYWVMANGKMQFDFWTLNKRLTQEVVSGYREALATVNELPRDAILTNTWKDVDVALLAPEKAWNAFCNAVLALKQLVEKQGA